MSALSTALPEYTRIRDGVLCVSSEEEAAVWLWARPDLLGWTAPIEWLLSPVTGNKKWPGDLWGVDADGELLIIENKLFGTGRRFDPYEDFHRYCTSMRRECHSDNLRATWNRLYRAETRYTDPLAPRISTAGILPRSVHRSRIRWWPELAKNIGAHIHKDKYRNNVERNLTRREQRKNPPPHYCGLLLSCTPRSELPAGIVESMARLKQNPNVGDNNVHLFIARALVRGGSVEITVETASAKAGGPS